MPELSSPQVIKSGSELSTTEDGRIVLDDPDLLKTISDLDEACVVTITVSSDCEKVSTPAAKPLKDVVVVNKGC